MEECRKEKDKVVVIDNNPQNPNLSSIKSRKCQLLIGDATDIDILKKARIKRAKSVFLLMADDIKQVKSCLIISQLLSENQKERKFLVKQIYNLINKIWKKKKSPLQLIMHLRNKEFLHTMRSQNVLKKASKDLTLRIFNVYENSARELFANNPPDWSGIRLDSPQYVQMIIMGLGQTGEALALQTAYTGHYLNGKRPRVLIIDRLANQKVPDFLARYPKYQRYCKLKYHQLDTHNPQLIRHLVAYLDDPNALTMMVVCFDESEYNILLGRQLLAIKSENKINREFEVFARINDDKLLSTISEELKPMDDKLPGPESEELKPFALPSSAYSKEVIMEGGILDDLAKNIYETFHKDENNTTTSVENSNKSKDWEDLSQEDKDSNRKAADHIGVKMRGIGCKIKDREKEDKPASFSNEEIELLAKLEHKRWCAEKFLAGWIYDEVDNHNERKNSNLLEWKKLPDEIKEKNRKAINDIPKVVAKMRQPVSRDQMPKKSQIVIRLPESNNHEP
jgi:hypothetical protein